MSQFLENFLTMVMAVLLKCRSNQLIVDTSSTLKVAIEKVENHLTLVQGYQQVLKKPTAGFTAIKKETRGIASDTCVLISDALISYAFVEKKTDLMKNAAITKEKLMKGGGTKTIDTLKYFAKLAEDNAEAILPYGITDAMISEFKTKQIPAFEAACPGPRNHAASRKNATKQSKVLCKEMSEMLTYSVDKGVEPFRTTENTFYSEYFTARMIIDLKGPSTGIKGNASDRVSKLKLKKAKVTVLEINSQRITSKKGNYSFKKLEPGIYTVTIELEGYQKVTQSDIVVNPGLMTILDFQLSKIAENLAA